MGRSKIQVSAKAKLGQRNLIPLDLGTALASLLASARRIVRFGSS